MSKVVEEYTALLARAFNGAITTKDGQRIVAHPSGILIVRGTELRGRRDRRITRSPE